MEISSVRVEKVEKEGSRMRGIASILIDGAFAVHDIKIIEGDNGMFIAMPSKKNSNGMFRDIVHPINQETRNEIQEAIFKAFKAFERIK